MQLAFPRKRKNCQELLHNISAPAIHEQVRSDTVPAKNFKTHVKAKNKK
jgi:hypothetical protein